MLTDTRFLAWTPQKADKVGFSISDCDVAQIIHQLLRQAVGVWPLAEFLHQQQPRQTLHGWNPVKRRRLQPFGYKSISTGVFSRPSQTSRPRIISEQRKHRPVGSSLEVNLLLRHNRPLMYRFSLKPVKATVSIAYRGIQWSNSRAMLLCIRVWLMSLSTALDWAGAVPLLLTIHRPLIRRPPTAIGET